MRHESQDQGIRYSKRVLRRAQEECEAIKTLLEGSLESIKNAKRVLQPPKRSWRDEPATRKQKAVIFTCRARVDKDLTKGEASTLIEKILEEQRLGR